MSDSNTKPMSSPLLLCITEIIPLTFAPNLAMKADLHNNNTSRPLHTPLCRHWLSLAKEQAHPMISKLPHLVNSIFFGVKLAIFLRARPFDQANVSRATQSNPLSYLTSRCPLRASLAWPDAPFQAFLNLVHNRRFSAEIVIPLPHSDVTSHAIHCQLQYHCHIAATFARQIITTTWFRENQTNTFQDAVENHASSFGECPH
ncbi:hypothetical protein BDV97DRAFT_341608 [Delphinella strobiligena]|nr:hypothetical protein BDV97DRAFT_341608 [Delphinella strobiligena]